MKKRCHSYDISAGRAVAVIAMNHRTVQAAVRQWTISFYTSDW